MIAAALYARVSTRDGRQTADNQIQEIERFAAARGFSIAKRHWYIDHRSGSKGEAGRDALAELMADAHGGHFQAVLVFALDRFTREGVFQAFGYIERLKAAGVQFYSVTEEHFTTSGFAGELFIAVSAWIAKQERERTRERINAGIARAKAEGKHCGRPKAIVDRRRALALWNAGRSLRSIGREFGVSAQTIFRSLPGTSARAAKLPPASLRKKPDGTEEKRD